MLSPILKKLQETVDNPGFYRPLTPEEQAELFLLLFAPKPKLFEKSKVIKGIDGTTPVADRDYLSKETTEKLLTELSLKTRSELEILVKTKLDSLTVKDGKDAEITPELIAQMVEMVHEMIEMPDFTTILQPEQVRDSLELIVVEEDKLRQDAIQNLPEDLEKIREDIARSKTVISGGLTKSGVLQLIAENASGIADTFETISKNLDASGATLVYTGNNLTSITYSNGIIKTLAYTGDNLTSVVLSGSTPAGINLTKTLSYTGDNLTGVVYS